MITPWAWAMARRTRRAAWMRTPCSSPLMSALVWVRMVEVSAANSDASTSSCGGEDGRSVRVDVEGPDRLLRCRQGVERMALMPSEWAFGVKAGHLVSSARDWVWNRRPSTEASMQGPSPVAYW